MTAAKRRSCRAAPAAAAPIIGARARRQRGFLKIEPRWCRTRATSSSNRCARGSFAWPARRRGGLSGRRSRGSSGRSRRCRSSRPAPPARGHVDIDDTVLFSGAVQRRGLHRAEARHSGHLKLGLAKNQLDSTPGVDADRVVFDRLGRGMDPVTARTARACRLAGAVARDAEGLDLGGSSACRKGRSRRCSAPEGGQAVAVRPSRGRRTAHRAGTGGAQGDSGKQRQPPADHDAERYEAAIFRRCSRSSAPWRPAPMPRRAVGRCRPTAHDKRVDPLVERACRLRRHRVTAAQADLAAELRVLPSSMSSRSASARRAARAFSTVSRFTWSASARTAASRGMATAPRVGVRPTPRGPFDESQAVSAARRTRRMLPPASRAQSASLQPRSSRAAKSRG